MHSSVYWKLLFVAKNTDKTELVFTLMEFTSQLGWAAMYPFPCNSAKLTLSLRSETTYQWIKRYFIYIITNLTLLQCSQKSSWLKDLRTAKKYLKTFLYVVYPTYSFNKNLLNMVCKVLVRFRDKIMVPVLKSWQLCGVAKKKARWGREGAVINYSTAC